MKEPQRRDSDHAVNLNFVNTTITNNNAFIMSAYKKYTDDQMKYAVQSTNKHHSFQYVRDHPAGQLFDEEDIERIKKPDKDYHKINKET